MAPPNKVQRSLSLSPALALLLLLVTAVPLLASAEDAASCGGNDGSDSSDSGMCTFQAGAASETAEDTGSALELWGNSISTCTRRVVLALLEKGLPDFKFNSLNLRFQEHKAADYVELRQPFGKIPALADGDLNLFESRAIARYIAEKYEGRGAPLLGSSPQERAIVNVWMEVEAHEFNPQASIIAYELVIGPRIRRIPNETRAHEAAEKLEDVLNVYEERLEENKYLAGESVSLADLNHMPLLAHLWAAGYGRLVEERHNLYRWWKDISSRRSWMKIVEGFPYVE